MNFGSSNIAINISKEADEYLMNYLKSKGYRPKPTEKYVKGLIQRLKRKGLKLKYYQSIDYGNKENTKDGTVIKGKVKMLCFIDSIDNPIKGIDMQQMLDNWKEKI